MTFNNKFVLQDEKFTLSLAEAERDLLDLLDLLDEEKERSDIDWSDDPQLIPYCYPWGGRNAFESYYTDNYQTIAPYIADLESMEMIAKRSVKKIRDLATEFKPLWD